MNGFKGFKLHAIIVKNWRDSAVLKGAMSKQNGSCEMERDYGVLAIIKMACVHNIFTEMVRIPFIISSMTENKIISNILSPLSNGCF